MTKLTNDMTVGVFTTRDKAQRAVNELKSLGFTDAQIGLVAKDDPTGSKWEEGTGIGAAAGAVTGTGLGLAVAVGLIPGVGPILAGGAIVALLASAGAGATAGTVLGGLIGLGVPEEDAAYYDGEVQAGRYVVTVKAAARAAEVKTLFARYEGYDRVTATVGHTTNARTATAAAGGQTVKLHDEQLTANKERVKTGSVDVRKEVHTEHKTITVPVQREEIVIERHAVNAGGRPGDIKAEEIRIPVSEERVTVGKQTVVKEEVTVGKRVVTDTKTVSGDVRSEELVVETDGKAKVRDERKGK